MAQIVAIIIAISTSVVSAMLVFFLQSTIKENRRLKKEKEQAEQIRDNAIVEGVRQLLSVRMEEMYDQYVCEERIPLRIYRRWSKMYKAYKALGGNGTFEHMNREMEAKHIRTRGDEDVCE